MATKVTLEQVKPITGDRWTGVHDLGDNNRCVDCTRGVLTLCRMEIFIKNHDFSTTEANKVTRAAPGSVRTGVMSRLIAVSLIYAGRTTVPRSGQRR